MAENQTAKEQQVAQLKEEINELRAYYSQLGDAFVSKEQLLTFDMLERHPLVTDQVAYEFQWDKVDALYQFVTGFLPGSLMMKLLTYGRQDMKMIHRVSAVGRRRELNGVRH